MTIGIIGAMTEEIIELKKEMTLIHEKKIGNNTFYSGQLLEKQIILVESGIGKVNAAISTTLLINEFKVDKIIFTGVAGCTNNNLNIGDIVISTALIEHDFDTTAFGDKFGHIPRMENSTFKADTSLIKIATLASEKIVGENSTVVGIIVSGDQFISNIDKINWLHEYFNSQCVEMEGAAVAHVCTTFNIPFVVIRSISDKADKSAHIDFKTFVELAARNSKNIVLEMLNLIS